MITNQDNELQSHKEPRNQNKCVKLVNKRKKMSDWFISSGYFPINYLIKTKS